MNNAIFLRPKVISLSFALFLVFGCSEDGDIIPADCTINGVEISSVIPSDANCGLSDGSLTVNVNGGDGEYRFSIDGENFQDQNQFSNLSAGSYVITVKDGKDCTVSETVFVQSISEMEITLNSRVEAGCETALGKLEITAALGEAPYQYKIEDGTYQSENTFENLEAGLYNVTAMDNNGCEVTSEFQVLSGISLGEHIIPIINNSCAVSGCHDGSNSAPDWTNETNIINNAGSIMTRTGNMTMPPSTSGLSLTDDEIAQIACWVNDGAEDN